MDFISVLALEFGLKSAHVENITALLDEGNTVPFIARYRKEMTGGCDDQTLRALADRLKYLRGLEKRREEVTAAIAGQEKLTPEVELAIASAQTQAELEDIYRPFRPKRRTRATIAEEKGLLALAEAILAAREAVPGGLEALAKGFVDGEKGVASVEEALAGASDIVAERISDDAELRKLLRAEAERSALLKSAGTKEEDSVYRLYYDFEEPVSKLPPHRVLALNRGEREEFLKVAVVFDGAAMEKIAEKRWVRPGLFTAPFMAAAAADSWERLLSPSIERELRSGLTDRANGHAISMFALNLKQLLLSPPVKGKTVLGFDPGYRTGCKLCVVNERGEVLDTGVIYPTPPRSNTAESRAFLKNWIKKYGVDCVAIGNGTASGESEAFVASVLSEFGGKVTYAVVNEAGASVYSASKLGAEEFPGYDVSERSAVSIARRLQDPLAELVKIDPKSIGVGQYQHDMPQARLGEALAGVVESAVNAVGVDLNTASPSLLAYVSGLSAAVAKNVAQFREENGGFSSRAQLKKVKKLGPKAFEQCAGFLRIPGGKNALDNTGVHPESYGAAEKLLALFGVPSTELKSGGADLRGQAAEFGLEKAAGECGVGVPTLEDILTELAKPGRDLRDELPPPLLRSGALDIKDLSPGMELDGTVRNVTDFGAFVDVGVHQDGLVHISELADRFVKHPSEVVSVGDVVKVRVLSAEAEKKRISLSMKKSPGRA